MKAFKTITFILLLFCGNIFGQEGPLGEWPDFTPIGFITAPHPQDPNYQTYLYGDWGAIVGEEFLVVEDSMLKLLYHSYHATQVTWIIGINADCWLFYDVCDALLLALSPLPLIFEIH